MQSPTVTPFFYARITSKKMKRGNRGMQRKPAAVRALSECFNKCSYCSEEMVLEYGKPNSITFDHVVAKSRGGKTKLPVCFNCNSQKSSKPLFTFLLQKHKDDYETISQVFYNVTSRVSPTERMQLLGERHGIYLGMRVGPANNFEPRGGRKALKKHKRAARKARLRVQGELFGDD